MVVTAWLEGVTTIHDIDIVTCNGGWKGKDLKVQQVLNPRVDLLNSMRLKLNTYAQMVVAEK